MSQELILTREQVRRVDQMAIEQWGMSGLVLMENAGRGCVDVLEQQSIRGPVVILCGQGNNGGDGFVIARHLAVRGYAAVSILCVPQEKLTGDAAVNFEILRRMQLPWFALENEPLETSLVPALASADWIVDALLGTGAKGPPRAPLNRVIELANQQTCQKLAVDIPSGLDCDSGIGAEPTFIANHTCTFVAAKPGLLLPAAKQWVGALHRLDIGIPHSLLHFDLKEL